VKKRNKIKPSVSKQIKADYLSTIESKSNLICTAPFTGLYITPDGAVKPCCTYWGNHSFGKYPQNSIKDILKSKNRKVLQRHIKKDNLEFGCQNCLQNIETGNYKGSISSLYQKYKQGKYPKVIDFELSHFCNLDCEMCYLHTNEKEATHIFDENFLKEIKPYLINAEATKFYGGEPFLINIYRDIWNIIIEKNPKCHIHIQTNATIFNEYVKSLLNRTDAFIGVSLDAMNPQLYEEIRKGAKFETVMSNIQSFNEIMKFQGKSLTISFCPMPKNWQELIPVALYAESINANLFLNTVNFPSRFSLKYLPSEILQEISHHIRTEYQSNIERITINKFEILNFLNSLDKQIVEQREIEKNNNWVSLDAFCEILTQSTNNAKLISDVNQIITDSNLNTEISPYIIAEIHRNSKANIEGLLKRIVNNKDYNYVRNLLYVKKY
jgi:radical SAM protein with 4Fe4S-binding SPASM domain